MVNQLALPSAARLPSRLGRGYVSLSVYLLRSRKSRTTRKVPSGLRMSCGDELKRLRAPSMILSLSSLSRVFLRAASSSALWLRG